MIATIRVTASSRVGGECTVDRDGERTVYTLTVGPERVCGVLVERLHLHPLRVGPIAEHLTELAHNEIRRGRGVTRYELTSNDGVVTHTMISIVADCNSRRLRAAAAGAR